MNDVTAFICSLQIAMDHGLLYLSYRGIMSKYLHLHMQFISCLLYPLFPVLSFSTMSLYGLWLLHMRLLILAAMIQSSLVLGKCRTLWGECELGSHAQEVLCSGSFVQSQRPSFPSPWLSVDVAQAWSLCWGLWIIFELAHDERICKIKAATDYGMRTVCTHIFVQQRH